MFNRDPLIQRVSVNQRQLDLVDSPMLSSKPTRPARSTDPRPPSSSTGSNNLRTMATNTTPTAYLPSSSASVVSSQTQTLNAPSALSSGSSSIASTVKGPLPLSRPTSAAVSADSFYQNEQTSEKAGSEPSSDPLDAFPSTNRSKSTIQSPSSSSSSPPSRLVSRANSPIQIPPTRPKLVGTSPSAKTSKSSDSSLAQHGRQSFKTAPSSSAATSCSICISLKQSPVQPSTGATSSTPTVQTKRIVVRAPRPSDEKKEGVAQKKRQNSLASSSSSTSLTETVSNKTKRTTPSDTRTGNSPDKGRKRLQLITAQANSFASSSSSPSSSSLALSASSSASPSYTIPNKSQASSSKPIKLRASLPSTQKRDVPAPIPIPVPVSVPVSVPVPIPIPIPVPTVTLALSSEFEPNKPSSNPNKRPLDDKSESDRPGKKGKIDRSGGASGAEKKKRKKEKKKDRENKVGVEAETEVRNKPTGETGTGAGTGNGSGDVIGSEKKTVPKKKIVEARAGEQDVRPSQVIVNPLDDKTRPSGVPVVSNTIKTSNSRPSLPQPSPPRSRPPTSLPSDPRSRPSSETRLETPVTVQNPTLNSDSTSRTVLDPTISTSLSNQRPVLPIPVKSYGQPNDNGAVLGKEKEVGTLDSSLKVAKKTQGKKKEAPLVLPLVSSNETSVIKPKSLITAAHTVTGMGMVAAVEKVPSLINRPLEAPPSKPLKQANANPIRTSPSSLSSTSLQAPSSIARAIPKPTSFPSSTSLPSSANVGTIPVSPIPTPLNIRPVSPVPVGILSKAANSLGEVNQKEMQKQGVQRKEAVSKENNNPPRLVLPSSAEYVPIGKSVPPKPSSMDSSTAVVRATSVSISTPTSTSVLPSELKVNEPQPKLVGPTTTLSDSASRPASVPRPELSRSSSKSTPTHTLLPPVSKLSSPQPTSVSRDSLPRLAVAPPDEQNILFDTALSDLDESIVGIDSPIEILDSDSDSDETISLTHGQDNGPKAVRELRPAQSLAFETLVMLSTSEEGEPALAIVQIFESEVSSMFYMLCKNCHSDDSFLCSKDDLQEAEFNETHRRMSWIFAMEDHSITFLENAMWKAFLKVFDSRLRTNPPASLPPQVLPEPPSDLPKTPSTLPEKAERPLVSDHAPSNSVPVIVSSSALEHVSIPPSLPSSKMPQVQKQAPLLSHSLTPPVIPSPSLVEERPKPHVSMLASPAPALPENNCTTKTNKLSRMTSSRRSYSIEIRSCILGSGRNDKFKLPKFCAISVKAQMANSSSYEDAQTIKQTTYYPRIRFEGPHKKTANFEPPLEFNLPPETFRILPPDWPFIFDQGLRQDTHLRLEIQFLSFTANHRKPCEWILNELSPFNQDKSTFQLPGCLVELVRPTGSDIDYLDLPAARLPLTIRGSVVLPKTGWGLDCVSSWNPVESVKAQQSLNPSSTSVSSASTSKTWTTQSTRRHTPEIVVPGVVVQPATDSPIKRNKSRVVKDDSESDTDFVDGASLTTGTSSDGGGRAHHERGCSSEADETHVKVPQPFTMVFNPDGPTFKPSPPRAPLPLNQRIWKGSLANNLTALDRGIRDPEIFEREEAIFDLEAIHDGQKFMMCLWNRWVDSYGRIQPWNSHGHIIGFVTRYFSTIDSANVRRYLVLHLETLSAFDLCNNDTFAEALALYANLKRNAVKSGVVKRSGR